LKGTLKKGKYEKRYKGDKKRRMKNERKRTPIFNTSFNKVFY
jgi:hypothetical protein